MDFFGRITHLTPFVFCKKYADPFGSPGAKPLAGAERQKERSPQERNGCLVVICYILVVACNIYAYSRLGYETQVECGKIQDLDHLTPVHNLQECAKTVPGAMSLLPPKMRPSQLFAPVLWQLCRTVYSS